MLAVIETHPIQYHAPVYRAVQSEFGISVTAIYGSDFSVVGYRDHEFGETFAWDTDLLAGYQPVIFSPYCVDTTPFVAEEAGRASMRATTRERMGIATDRTVLLFSGKLSSRKGADLLLRAIKQMPTERRNATVVLFLGSGDLRRAL